MEIVIIYFLVFLMSVLGTGLIRHISLKKAILDIPNARSSHSTPTPRGGGIAIAISFFCGVLWLWCNHFIATNLTFALVGGGLIIAIVGYWDDVSSLSAKWRFLFHMLAASFAVYLLGGMPTFEIGTLHIHLGWIGTILAVIAIIWLINLYNFMDGIDGLAGSEAVFTALSAGLLLSLVHASGITEICFLLVAASLGFLVWNWPPAKIFLGDVGSGLLGFIFGVLILVCNNQHTAPITFWLILLAVFIFDATFTLIHRIIRKESWYSAHRDHVYQRLIKSGASHKKVTCYMLLTNLFILFPLSYFSLHWQIFSVGIYLFLLAAFLLFWFRLIKQHSFPN